MDKIYPWGVSRVLVRDVARTIAGYLVNGAGVMFHDIIYIYIYKIPCRPSRRRNNNISRNISSVWCISYIVSEYLECRTPRIPSDIALRDISSCDACSIRYYIIAQERFTEYLITVATCYYMVVKIPLEMILIEKKKRERKRQEFIKHLKICLR